MKFKIETEGGSIYPMPISYEGNAEQLPIQHERALNDLFLEAEKFKVLKENPLGNDETKYSIEINDNGMIKSLSLVDSNLSELPSNISQLLIFLRNRSLNSQFKLPDK